jgi:hypothetical protein
MDKKGRVLQVSIVAFGGAAAIAGVSLWFARAAPTPASPQQPQSVTQLSKAPSDAVKIPAASSATNTPGSIDYKKDFSEAPNYWDYAHRLLPAAKAGNPDAQFYLSRVLERCDEDNRMYFQRRGQKIGLDEGLQYAVKRHLLIEVAQSIYEKCHEFQDNDLSVLGSAPDWLAKATAAGQPLAETTTASKLLIQEVQQNAARAGGVPNPNANSLIEGSSDPRTLLRSAVESKDPEVLFAIGDAQGTLHPVSPDSDATRFAWWLVACQRGYDCSENADWVKNSCGDNANCRTASSPSDRVRTLAGDLWPDVQQRAQEISVNLDAGQWDNLGLGSAAAPASSE